MDMGYNTVVVLFNDQHDRWPAEIRDAMRATCGGRYPREAHFGYGSVISTDHADSPQIVVAERNMGKRLTSRSSISDGDLAALEVLMLSLGYQVRAPGAKRAQVWTVARREAEEALAKEPTE
jgi:hypothetical protein